MNGSTSGTSRLDPSRNEVTRTYPWGTVRTGYVASGGRLTLTITTTNQSGNTITGLFLEPYAIRFPSKPAEYDGNIPILGHNTGQPTVLKMTAGQVATVLTNDDATKPLMVGFPFALDRPAPMQLFPLRVNTGREVTYPNSLPAIDRPIAPGASDTYSISLRFAPASASVFDVAADVYASFKNRYSYRLSWPDRRPIASLILATAATGWSTNPRGWLLDPSINVTTPAGVEALRTRILKWADDSVAILRDMNAQGMITWDIEGEQFPHATTYAGDPRMFETLAPEMAGIADEYFRKFRDAGFRVGVCIRPQQLVVSADGRTGRQEEVADPAALLISKIQYARNRWGATLFYMDSNGDPNLPMSVEVLERVVQAVPGVLILPEHQNLAYYSISAPYDELRGGTATTPALVRQVYPGAFTVINTADGPIDARYNDLAAAVQQGDSLMFRGWFADPGNAKVKNLYGVQGDSTPPAVAINSPSNSQQLTGTVTLLATASDSNGVPLVRYFVDGSPISGDLSAAPYSFAWDTRLFPNGSHALEARARDSAGNEASARVTITLSNAAPDVTAPVVAFTAPANGAKVSGTVGLQVTASDNSGAVSVQFQLDGASFGGVLTAPPFAVSWDTTQSAEGAHSLSAIARDASGNTTTATISVTVSNLTPDTTNPSVSFTAPANGAFVSGLLSATVTASDNIGVTGVQFKVDDVSVGNLLTQAPYTFQLNTQPLPAGAHQLAAVAYDAAGNTATATVGIIVVAVSVPDTVRPTVSMMTPVNNSSVTGQVALTSAAWDNIAVASVRYYIDGVFVGQSATAPYDVTLDTRRVLGGVHYLKADALDSAGNVGSATVSFNTGGGSTPVCGDSGYKVFIGCYYNGDTLSDLRLARLDPQLNFDWAATAPSPLVPRDGFSVRWLGQFAFETGNYFFELWIDDGFRLFVDDAPVLDAWDATGLKNYTKLIALSQGTHTIRLEYKEREGAAVAKLGWTRR